MRRANRAAWESWVLGYNFDPFAIRSERFLAPEHVGVWKPMHTPERGERILQLRRRPTTADLRRFLAGSFPWDPAGSFLISATIEPTARAWLVDGNVVDASWRAATGDAPFWSYPPTVERRK